MTINEVRERLLNGACLNEIFDFIPGQECDIYKAKEWNPGDDVIYIPDIYLNNLNIHIPFLSNEVSDVLSYCYTGKDFMELCDGNEELAKELFDYVDWESPSSALDEIDYKEV